MPKIKYGLKNSHLKFNCAYRFDGNNKTISWGKILNLFLQFYRLLSDIYKSGVTIKLKNFEAYPTNIYHYSDSDYL